MSANWKGTIGAKLTTSFGVLLLLVLVLGFGALSMTTDLSNQLENAVKMLAKKQMLAGRIRSLASEMESIERGLNFATVLQQTDKAESYKSKFERAESDTAASLNEFQALAGADEVSALRRNFDELLSAHRSMLAMLAAQQMDHALKSFDETILPRLGNMNEESRKLVEAQSLQMASVTERAAASKTRSRWVVLTLIALSLGAGVGVIAVVRKSTARLRQITEQMAASAAQVGSASQEINTVSQTVARGAIEQASSLEETSASSQEMSTVTRQNAERSQKATQLVVDVDRKVAESNRQLERMVASMTEINESSRKIAKIIKVIDEISFQTNILALNAAVEAARAGEAGMGFAVVADEVRNLAQRCAQAARDTASLIEDSIAKSNEGSSRLEEMAGSIRSITTSTAHVKQLVEEVSRASTEQSTGIDQIAAALTQMERLTQQAASSAHQSASSSEQMASEADSMALVVQELVGLVGSESR